MQKYGNINADDIQLKLDAIKQKPKEKFISIMKGWISFFNGVKYKMQNNVTNF